MILNVHQQSVRRHWKLAQEAGYLQCHESGHQGQQAVFHFVLPGQPYLCQQCDDVADRLTERRALLTRRRDERRAEQSRVPSDAGTVPPAPPAVVAAPCPGPNRPTPTGVHRRKNRPTPTEVYSVRDRPTFLEVLCSYLHTGPTGTLWDHSADGCSQTNRKRRSISAGLAVTVGTSDQDPSLRPDLATAGFLDYGWMKSALPAHELKSKSNNAHGDLSTQPQRERATAANESSSASTRGAQRPSLSLVVVRPAGWPRLDLEQTSSGSAAIA